VIASLASNETKCNDFMIDFMYGALDRIGQERSIQIIENDYHDG